MIVLTLTRRVAKCILIIGIAVMLSVTAIAWYARATSGFPTTYEMQDRADRRGISFEQERNRVRRNDFVYSVVFGTTAGLATYPIISVILWVVQKDQKDPK